MTKSQWVIVRTPGHWIHVGLLEEVTDTEIRLTNAYNIPRYTGGLQSLKQAKPANALPVGNIVFDRGPGVYRVECDKDWE